MKVIFVIFCLITCVSASGQKSPDAKITLSIDIVSLSVNRTVRIGFHHSVSERWSAGGRIAVQIPEHAVDSVRIEHANMLQGREEPEKYIIKSVRPELSVGMRFWSGRFFSGGYTSFSCIYNVFSGADMALGFGYAAGIWKGLGISAGYEIRIKESLKRGKFDTSGITISVNYTF